MNTILLRGLLAAGAASILMGSAYLKGRDDGRAKAVDYGEAFARLAADDRQACRADKAVLVSQIGWDRQRQQEQADACLDALSLTGEARERAEQALQQESDRAYRARVEAYDALLALQEEQSAWKSDPIPESIRCRVLRGEGCPAPGVQSPPGSDDDPAAMDVRERAAGGVDAGAVPEGAAAGDE